jgi:deoxyribonuclease-4
MATQQRPLLGAHVSAARSTEAGRSKVPGLVNALTNGERIGAECIQIFGASPRSYAAQLPKVEDVVAFKQALAASSIKSVYQHGAYLVNLGSADPLTLKKSIANAATHLRIAHMIGARGVVFHVGSPNGGDRRTALDQAAGAIKEILSIVDSQERGVAAQFIMENSGSVKKIGGTLSDLAYIFKKVKDSRMGVCIDTAHALESGLIESYTAPHITRLCDALDAEIGLSSIPVLHANDSKTPYNSQNDKHENIGEGYIGTAGFRALAAEKRLAHTSWFLEVPGFDGLGPDKKNLDRLKECFA